MFSTQYLSQIVDGCRRRFATKQPDSRRRCLLLQLEALEDRYLLSGNINTYVSGGSLFVFGDAQANSVRIAVENGNVVVAGTEHTSINRKSTPFIAFRGTNRIRGDLFVFLRQGNDELLVDDGLTIQRSAFIYGEAGHDTIGLGQTTIRSGLHLFAAGGNDQVALKNTRIGRDAVLFTEGGNDVFSSDGARIGGNLLFFGGAGNNAIALKKTSVNRDATLITAGGQDSISIVDSVVRDDLTTLTGSGNDFLHVDPTTVGDRTLIDLGGGNDNTIMTGGNVFTDRALLFGGGGMDSIQVDSGNRFSRGRQNVSVESKHVADSQVETRLNDPKQGVLAKATAAQKIFGEPAPDPDIELTLTVDTDANSTVSSSDTLLTNQQTFTVSGRTSPGATVAIARDGDDVFDDASVVADGSGNYVVTVQLVHDDANRGANNLQIRATDGAGQQLTESVNVHYAVGTVVRFASTEGTFDIELYDDDAPQTVANFLGYLDRYQDLIVQRSSKNADGSDFVIQAGRFTYDGTTLVEVAKDAPIQNEHSADNPNERGTLSTALAGGDRNSATSEWFVNMSDANTFLDARGHTVFGRVIGAGMDVADKIHDLPTEDLNAEFGQPAGGALSDVPVKDLVDHVHEENLVVFTGIDVLLTPPETFGAVTPGSYEDPDLLGVATYLEPGAPEISGVHGAEHVLTAVDYSAFSNPPTYGPHHGVTPNITPRPTGVYNRPQPDEDLVHNLEHGNIWISYDPSLLSEANRIALEHLVSDGGEDTGVILTPRPKNTSAIALASWGHLLELDRFDAAQIRDFIDTNRGHGPEGFIPSGQKPANGDTLDDGLPHSP